jgi:DNA-directed RNA polymerase alpha subunit
MTELAITLPRDQADAPIFVGEDNDLATLGLPARVDRRLHLAGIYSIATLTERSDIDLLRLPGFGWGSLTAVRVALAARGLALAAKWQRGPP